MLNLGTHVLTRDDRAPNHEAGPAAPSSAALGVSPRRDGAFGPSPSQTGPGTMHADTSTWR